MSNEIIIFDNNRASMSTSIRGRDYRRDVEGDEFMLKSGFLFVRRGDKWFGIDYMGDFEVTYTRGMFIGEWYDAVYAWTNRKMQEVGAGFAEGNTNGLYIDHIVYCEEGILEDWTLDGEYFVDPSGHNHTYEEVVKKFKNNEI